MQGGLPFGKIELVSCATGVVLESKKGDALPLGAASAAALSGRAVQGVSAATLVLSGTLP